METQMASRETTEQITRMSTSRAATTVKKVAAIVVLVLATLSLATAQIPECAPGTLSDYAMLGPGGCLIGDKKFSNFSYYHRGPNGLPSSSISVTPGTVPDSEDAGILFEGKWTAPVPKESFVTYTIEVQPNGKPIHGASLQMQSGEITGTGQARVVAKLCPMQDSSDSCGSEGLNLKVVLSKAASNHPVDQGQFKSPLTAVRVSTPVDVFPGSGGSAALKGFMTVFTQ